MSGLSSQSLSRRKTPDRSKEFIPFQNAMEMDCKPSNDMAILLSFSELCPEITPLSREEKLITTHMHLGERREMRDGEHREDDLVCSKYM